MKFTQFTLAAAALLVTVSAQGLDALPDCSKSCATSSIPASCGLNVQCICADKSFLSNIACCVADKCSQADQETTLQVAKGICSRGGVTDLPSTISCASSAGSSSGSVAATGTSSGTSTGSSTQTTTGSSQATGTNTTLSGSVSATKTGASTTGTGASSASSSASKSASSAAATTGAAVLGQTRDSSLMAAAGAAAAFAIFV
ncbi:Cell wall protein TIR3 [Penicillium subrubescens]|uniref:GPI anchored CFEM domain protein C n=1 Tax=Penicillium subrubescens TaxID=1316194 RepID=A0A1Q5T1C8_9EURO|nr:Cell wall protein TIR3 [Penicillium subrubescens]KAJ5911293.1 Cell wall protein TIR3 [Penicillium subrubescens]OKO93976.1 GPI anchored CFEM domain protein C [Penicillium subrubescens]